ncbi:Uma2 family endonuclease [Myxococcota bacterium]|nr:Uma2 family endonuclease [Myxococcota bacterium]
MTSAARPTRRPATYEDLLAVPDRFVAQILDGELVTLPRPSLDHGEAAWGLTAALDGPFRRGRGGPGGWWILAEPEVHLGTDVVVPDLAGWRRDKVPERPRGAYATAAPDWVCEILSPSTQHIDRVRKLRIYAREAVGHAWLIDPQARTLEVYRRGGGFWSLVATHGGDETVRAEPFDAVELPLSLLWGEG